MATFTIRYVKFLYTYQHINSYRFCSQAYKFPAVRPRWPPGGWSPLSEKIAWELHSERMNLESEVTAKLRLEKLAGEEPQSLVLSTPYALVPRRKQHIKYISKTAVFENSMPDKQQNIDTSSVAGNILPYIRQNLGRMSKTGLFKSFQFNQPLHHEMIGTVLNTIVSHLAHSSIELHNCHIDENCRVESFWRRHGYQDADDSTAETKLLVGKGSRFHNMVKYQYKHVANWQVRNENPVIQFAALEDDICTGSSEDHLYSPMKMGDLTIQEKPINVAGVWINDPCEFTSLSVHCLGSNNKRFQEMFPGELDDHMVTVAFHTAFGSCLAQAHNQGFNWLMDVTYPFTTQTVVFDGRRLVVCWYQLNTLRLWVDDTGNPLRNLAWVSNPIPLYDTVEDGKVRGLNEEALAVLIKCLLVERIHRPVEELRPYLPASSAPSQTRKFLNHKGEPAVDPPNIGRFEYPRNSEYFFSFVP